MGLALALDPFSNESGQQIMSGVFPNPRVWLRKPGELQPGVAHDMGESPIVVGSGEGSGTLAGILAGTLPKFSRLARRGSGEGCVV